MHVGRLAGPALVRLRQASAAIVIDEAARVDFSATPRQAAVGAIELVPIDRPIGSATSTVATALSRHRDGHANQHANGNDCPDVLILFGDLTCAAKGRQEAAPEGTGYASVHTFAAEAPGGLIPTRPGTFQSAVSLDAN